MDLPIALSLSGFVPLSPPAYILTANWFARTKQKETVHWQTISIPPHVPQSAGKVPWDLDGNLGGGDDIRGAVMGIL